MWILYKVKTMALLILFYRLSGTFPSLPLYLAECPQLCFVIRKKSIVPVDIITYFI